MGHELACHAWHAQVHSVKPRAAEVAWLSIVTLARASAISRVLGSWYPKTSEQITTALLLAVGGVAMYVATPPSLLSLPAGVPSAMAPLMQHGLRPDIVVAMAGCSGCCINSRTSERSPDATLTTVTRHHHTYADI